MERILDIKNLRISFRTNNGRVKAVRDISFNLNKGETIAIVGESGSGKSVTAKAMMGILAPNAIVEGGEILYDGMDLMKISEEEFHELRGNRISMIFQDPLSSLNPIVKIGKQLTEAMILNGKATQRDAKHRFENITKLIEEAMVNAYGADAEKAAKAKENVAILKKFIEVSNKYEMAYNASYDKLEGTLSDAEGMRIDIIGKQKAAVVKKTKELLEEAKGVVNPFLVTEDNAAYPALLDEIKATSAAYNKSEEGEDFIKLLEQLKETLKEVQAKERPNFFGLGYYLTYADNAKTVEELAKDIPAMNKMAQELLEANFLNAFLKDIAEGLKYADKASAEKKVVAKDAAERMLEFLNAEIIDRAELKKRAEALIKDVEASINRVEIIKDSTAYTFKAAMNAAVTAYLYAMKLKDKKHLNRVEKIAFENTDYNLVVSNMILVVTRLRDNYVNRLENVEKDFDKDAVALVEFVKEQSAKMVYRVTKAMAKNRAIELMEEVGIPMARKRYNQYPFEFSGGMRQRIVIAIALSANPDILICDEPTTALDVTIQSQILELINELKVKRQLSVIFITHDLGVVANMADKIAVMYAGKVVEEGTVDEIFYDPKHPYTWALLSSMPDIYTEERLEAIPGTPPNMIVPPVGDAFAARNRYALKIDYEKQPPMFKVTDTHYAATWLLHPDAPKVEPPKIVTERIARMKNLEAQRNE